MEKVFYPHKAQFQKWCVLGPISSHLCTIREAGTTIPSGGSLGDTTFTYDFGGVQMAVTDGDQFGGGGPWDTTSSPNFLGTDDSDIFQSGDDFTLTFEGAQAIGMYFISIEEIGVTFFDDDIALTASGETALLDVDAIEQTLPDGSNVFFLGVVDPMAKFTSAEVTSTCCGDFLFNVDDVVTAVPEPGTFAILGAGLAGLGFVRRRRGSSRWTGEGV